MDAERVIAYAAATNDDNPLYADGSRVPPVFGVVPAWSVLMRAVTDVVPADAQSRLLHGEHDLHFHQPLAVGQTLVSTGEIWSVRTARTGSRLTLRVRSATVGGDPVLDQYATMFLRGLAAAADAGPDPPGHGFPDEAREHALAEVVRHVDADQTVRYAAASGDHNPIHLDEAAARAVRLPGIVLHGLCTMAMCGAAVVDAAAGGDPARLRRLAVQFSWPVFPGHDLTCSLFRVPGPGEVAFEAVSRGKVVVRDGRADVLASP